MPGRSGRRRRGGRRSRVDVDRYPLLYRIKAGQSGITYVTTISDTFDRTRPFRIGAIRGEMSSEGSPAAIQIQVYGPISSSDNIWSSPVLVIPTGTIRRFRYRIPPTNGWFPSGVNLQTPLMQIFANCVATTDTSVVHGMCYITILMRPREIDNSCPRGMLAPLMAQGPGPSGVRPGIVPCDDLITFSSSEDEDTVASSVVVIRETLV